MKTKPEHRHNRRYSDKIPLELEDCLTGFRYRAVCYNRSRKGMYVETAYAPRPTRKLRFHLSGTQRGVPSRQGGAVEVRWRRMVSGDSSPAVFGIGLQRIASGCG
jgi:hypothetical protein